MIYRIKNTTIEVEITNEADEAGLCQVLITRGTPGLETNQLCLVPADQLVPMESWKIKALKETISEAKEFYRVGL